MRSSLPIVVAALALACPTAALAQEPTRTLDQLRLIVSRGDLVTVSSQGDARVRGRILAVQTDRLVVDTGHTLRAWSADELHEVRRRRGDSVVNGAIIGAAAGAGIDALIRSNPVIYRRSAGGVSWRVAPALSVDARRAGVQLSIGY